MITKKIIEKDKKYFPRAFIYPTPIPLIINTQSKYKVMSLTPSPLIINAQLYQSNMEKLKNVFLCGNAPNSTNNQQTDKDYRDLKTGSPDALPVLSEDDKQELPEGEARASAPLAVQPYRLHIAHPKSGQTPHHIL